MDKHDLFHKACQQFGSLQNPEPPMKVDWMSSVAWKLLFDWPHALDGLTCLVYLAHNNSVGIAEADTKGYIPTPCHVYPGVDGSAAVRWFNENILGVSEKQAQVIITSTMRR